MKQINQKKLDKAFQILLLILMDFTTAYALVEQILLINYSNVVKSIPQLIMLLGFLPFIISQHLKYVPKHIEAKLIYLLVFSSDCIVASIFITEIYNEGFSEPISGIFNLITALLFVLIGLILIIKLFTSEQITNAAN